MNGLSAPPIVLELVDCIIFLISDAYYISQTTPPTAVQVDYWLAKFHSGYEFHESSTLNEEGSVVCEKYFIFSFVLL